MHQYLRDGGERAFLFWPNVIGWLAPWCDSQVTGNQTMEVEE